MADRLILRRAAGPGRRPSGGSIPLSPLVDSSSMGSARSPAALPSLASVGMLACVTGSLVWSVDGYSCQSPTPLWAQSRPSSCRLCSHCAGEGPFSLSAFVSAPFV